MGVTQFYQGVETVRSLTSLAILTGNLGKPSVGVNPVRGQNNVQGACDMGALPDTYPGYQYVKFPENREKFAKAWGVESLPAHTGYRISELPHRAAHGEVRAAYIMVRIRCRPTPNSRRSAKRSTIWNWLSSKTFS